MGQPKATILVDGRTLAARSVAALHAAGIAPVRVVLGAGAEQVLVAGSLELAEVLINQDWVSGMASSLRCGLADWSVPAVLIVLVDVPELPAAVVARLVDTWRQGALAVVATYDGEQGHPVLLDGSVLTEVADAAIGDSGAKRWLGEHTELVVGVPCSDIGKPDDLDTPTDLARWHDSQIAPHLRS